MRVQNETSSVAKIVPPAVRTTSEQRGSVHHHRHHDIGEDIAALDEHWVFRKAR